MPNEKIQQFIAKLSHEDKVGLFNALKQELEASTAITDLALLVQKRWGVNICPQIRKEGLDHEPVIHCDIKLPNDKTYSASGRNQRVAKQLCAEEALKDLTKI